MSSGDTGGPASAPQTPAQASPPGRHDGARPASREPILPEQTRDDTDAGWGDARESNDERLRRERPPHWE